jgi:hypothetical protein
MLVLKNIFNFSYRSHRGTVPKIMRDPQITKTGVIGRVKKPV